MIKCENCGYLGDVDTYLPCLSVYNDIRCPKCKSTNNKHNEDYQHKLFESMKEKS